jgi:dynamin 1-like protein
MAHIRERLPDIKARLNTLMGQTEQELASYGDAKWFSKENRGPLILQLMTKFAAAFIASIEGTSSDISTKELCGGARIYYIYNDVFGRSLSKIDPVASLSYTDVRTAIRNSTGPRPSLFVPELAFDLLVKPQIKLLEGPSQRCVELVYEELMKICHNCASPELARFPKLQGKLIEVISDLLRERLGPTSSYVSSLIDIQRAYINTNHPDFLGAAAAMSAVLEERQTKEKKAKEAHAATLAKKLTSQASDEAIANGDTTSLNGDFPDEVKHAKHRHPSRGANGVAHPASTLNGEVSPVLATQQRDSFLNYFFGKDGSEKPSHLASGVATPNTRSSHLLADEIIHQSSTDAFSLRDMDSHLDPELAQLSEREVLECELIRRLISSYFDIVRQTTQDQVPKAVMHLLVNFSKNEAQNRLVSELYKEELFDDLLYEDENLAQERQKCENMLRTYREAARVVGEVV